MQTWVAFKSATNLLLPIKIQKAFEIFVTFVGKNQISFGLRQSVKSQDISQWHIIFFFQDFLTLLLNNKSARGSRRSNCGFLSVQLVHSTIVAKNL